MSDYFGTYEYESGMLRHGKPMDGDGGVFYLPHQCMEHQSAPPPERAILTDLIAELRKDHRQRCECHCECGERWGWDGPGCGSDAALALDPPEARLREVSMSLTKGHGDE